MICIITRKRSSKINIVAILRKLVLIRHGQSLWNAKNLFTGWRDVDLSKKGMKEARDAGRKLAHHEIKFDHAFTSALLRAKKTCQIILDEMGLASIPITANLALNERDYGALTGLNKDLASQKYGTQQIHQWRRSFSTRPPQGESLEDTYLRVLPYYEKHIAPLWQKNQNILVVAHGNSLRALVMALEKKSQEDIIKVEIPTGVPLIYALDCEKQISRLL